MVLIQFRRSDTLDKNVLQVFVVLVLFHLHFPQHFLVAQKNNYNFKQTSRQIFSYKHEEKLIQNNVEE